jgi:hypothetical protein
VDARLVAMNSWRDFIEQPQYERVLAKLRGRLGTDNISKVMASGEAMTERQAFDLAGDLSACKSDRA